MCAHWHFNVVSVNLYISIMAIGHHNNTTTTF
uniref:Uncharacterized protein n=1 Tax=Arundo donax TaxID=35708 RepID=A0A0A8ZTH1_ARUDO